MSDRTMTSAQPIDTRLQRLVSFTIKTIIVGTIVTISLFILIDEAISDVDDLIGRRIGQLHAAITTTGGKFEGKTFWARVEQALDRAADPKNEIGPERKQKLLADIHILADRARPFIAEAATAFSSASPADTVAQKK